MRITHILADVPKRVSHIPDRVWLFSFKYQNHSNIKSLMLKIHSDGVGIKRAESRVDVMVVLIHVLKVNSRNLEYR